MIFIPSSCLCLPPTSYSNLCLNLHNYSMRPNTLDSLKVCAIVFMIIDHIGYFLLPDILRLRVIGRRAFPLFFYVIWYHGSSKIDYKLMWAMVIAQLPFKIFPLNILFIAGLSKLILRFDIQKYAIFISIICLWLSYFVAPYIDYGLMGICRVLFGRYRSVWLGLIAFVWHGMINQPFWFDMIQWIVAYTGLLIIFYTPAIDRWMPRATLWISQHTLEIYLVHVMILYGIRRFIWLP